MVTVEGGRRLRATPDVQFLCKLAPAQVLRYYEVSVVSPLTPPSVDSIRSKTWIRQHVFRI